MKKEDVINTIRDILEEDDYRYDFNPEQDSIIFNLAMDNKLKSCRLVIGFAPHGFNIFAVSPISADDNCMDEMRKYLSMVNATLINGGFDLHTDGDIAYRCWLSTGWLEKLPKEALFESLSIAFNFLRLYGDGIAAIAFGFSNAETEFKKAQEKRG